ncbi:MAG TPA: glycoside hydrolase family 3 N-terminal domain-containing protein [Actinoallomurus sp.]|jgi:beta-N-acetylhexosaminidase|nr:glycoside hydrolase family 3 N-terminal domain-containing protein [Actinoallomurus sp.]
MSDPSLERLVNATLLVPFPGAAAPRWVLEGLERGVSGVTLFAINGNVPSAGGLTALTAGLRESSEALVSIDEEGGDVTRLAHETGSPYPGSAALGALDDTAITWRVHRSLGAELRGAGVNLDFAPSADVNTADDNPIIGTRAFGSDPALVARHITAAVSGLQEAGVAACAKHFPGHGATSQDSHLEVPAIDADLPLLERREMVPFRAAIEAGVQSIMTAHIRVPALTGATPATLSPAAINGLLRGTLGYDGVVVTDALDMRAASGAMGIPEAAVRALAAGADLLCLGSKEYEDSVRAIREQIMAAVSEGRLSAERLEESAARIAALKAWLAVPRTAEVDRAAGLEAARRAIRVTGSLSTAAAPVVVELQAPSNIAVGPVPWGFGPWTPDAVPVDAETADPDELLTRATGRPLVIVVRDAHRYAGHRALVTTLLTARPDAVLVEMGLPVWRPEAATYVATYGATRANARAAAELLGLVGEETEAGGAITSSEAG